MKFSHHALLLVPLVIVTSCGVQQDVGSFDSVGYDPLLAPGTRRVTKVEVNEMDGDVENSDSIVLGSYVEVLLPNTNFFSEFPNPKSKPTSVLAKGVALQVLDKTRELYRVRQVETGKEGYVVIKAVSSQPVLPDIEPIDPSLYEALGEGVEVVDTTLPPLGDDLTLDPIGMEPTGVVADDGVDGGVIVVDSDSSTGALVEDVPSGQLDGVVTDTATASSEVVEEKPKVGPVEEIPAKEIPAEAAEIKEETETKKEEVKEASGEKPTTEAGN